MANPTLQELINRCNADFVAQFQGVDPTIPSTFVGCFPEMVAARAFELYGSQSLLENRLLLNTTSNDFLDAYASALKMTRNTASQSHGNLVITGSNGTSVPIGTIFNSDQGISYSTDASVNIATVNFTLSTFDVLGVLVTVTTTSAHNLATGMVVNTGILNVPPEIIGNHTVVVISATQFTYTTITAAASGTYINGVCTATFANVAITSVPSGANTNASDGTQLALQTPIAGVSTTAFVAIGGLTGGADVENDTDFLARVLYRVRNPIAYQSTQMIINLMYSYGGITRVWVRKLVPTNGYTVYYVRDRQSNPFPSPADIAAIDAKFPKPAEIPDSNVVIAAPVNRVINFVFASITPDTATLRTAITNSLQQFFRETVTMGFEPSGSTITVNQYTRPIQIAIDPDTGLPLEDFVLATVDGVAPAPISINADELPTLGSVLF